MFCWFAQLGALMHAGRKRQHRLYAYVHLGAYAHIYKEHRGERSREKAAPRRMKTPGYHQPTFPKFPPVPYHITVRFCKRSKTFRCCLFWRQLMGFDIPYAPHDMVGFPPLVVAYSNFPQQVAQMHWVSL